MAKRNKAKFASKGRKSALRVEALEQRQLLAVVTGGGTEVGHDIVHPNGNVYDQVLMTGASVTVTADPGQVTRVSFLDLSGDIVQAEFSGKGSLTISLDNFSNAAPPANYNQPDVSYVMGKASFTIQGSDATTNFGVFSVGPGNAVNQNLFAGGKTGGNHFADVENIRIVSDPTNPGGFSNFGGIRAGNAIFANDNGVVGIAAANVEVQGPVVLGDIDASNTGVPTLNFGGLSQFATLTVAGGDLVQTNGQKITGGTASGIQAINFTAGSSSLVGPTGTPDVSAKVNNNADLFTGAEPVSTTLDSSATFDLTGKSQTDINNFFLGRTFTNALTVTGNLGSGFNISASEFRGKLTINGSVAGTITTTSTLADTGFSGGLEITGDVSNTITATSISTLKVGGALSSSVTATGKIGSVTLGSVAEGRVSASSLGDISVTGNVTGDGAGSSWVFKTTGNTSTSLGNIGSVTIGGDVNLDNATDRLLLVSGTGTFGNVALNGGGSLGGTGTVAALNLGVLEVADFGAGQTTTGTITIKETANANWGGAVIGTVGTVTGKLGDISITGGGATGQTLTLSGRIGASNIGGDLVEVGAVSVSSFGNINANVTGGDGAAFSLIGGSKAGNISLSTIAGTTTTASTIDVTDLVSLDDGSATTGEILGNISIDAGQTANNTLGLHSTFNTFAQYDKGAQIGTVTLAGKAITQDSGVDIQAATIGAVSYTGGTTINGTTGIKSSVSVASLTVTGNLTLNAGDTHQLTPGGTASATVAPSFSTIDGNIEVKDIGAISVTGNLTVGTGLGKGTGIAASGTIASITVGGAASFDSTNASNIQAAKIGDVSVTGKTTFTNSTFASISVNDATSAQDTLGNVSLGQVVGAAGVEISASSVGNVTITSKLTQDQILVDSLDIIAAPHSGSNSSKSEQVNLDGSNLSVYSIGNISVSSQLDLAYTGTKLFKGDNSFVALGKIGDITITGATAGAQQSQLFNANTDAAWFAVGDVDGLMNATANLAGNFNFGSTSNATPDYTGGTVTVGNIKVNAQQTNTTTGYSGVDLISGNNATSADIEGFSVLSGARMTAANADIVTLGAAGASTLGVAKVDSDLKGTIGSVLISSNNAVGSLDTMAGVANLIGTAGYKMSGIVAATSVGALQSSSTSISSSSTTRLAIIGDVDSVTDDTIETGADASNQIIVVAL